MDRSESAEDRPLPPGWICQVSKSRKKQYYFNKITGESSWKHPLDIDLSSLSREGVLKRSAEDEKSSTSSKKKKKNSKHKKQKTGPPSKQSNSVVSPRCQSLHQQKKNDVPQMTTGSLNTNPTGQEQLCNTSKVCRISAWVDSVDYCYAPTEQGTCVTSPAHSHAESVGFFSFPHTQEPNKVKSSPAKELDKRDVSSKHPSPLGEKSSAISGSVIASAVKKNNSERRRYRSCSNTSGNPTPVGPWPPQLSVSGQVTSDKTNTSEEIILNSATVHQIQSSEDMQLDSQQSFHSYANDNLNGGHDRTQFDDDEMAMDIDNYEELEDQIRHELQGIRSEFVIDPLKVTEDSSKDSAVSYSDTLYVVLDTNVLLSHLKLISELKDFPIEGVARPVLVVPWIVIQELDSLKSDSWKIRKGKLVTNQKQSQNGKFGVDTLARQAVRFLHACFERSHPRVRGQTLSEAQEMMESCSMEDPSNDDKILQCCLLFQRKADKGHAILFSNDQNLCSKAIINGLKAFNHQSLISGLRELFQSSAVVLKQDYFKDYYKELKHQETLADKRAKADDLICELQCIMREGLAVAVETEMRAAYDDLWDKIVFIKPPWTLADLLQLLDKHWIAVFGQVFKRNTKSTVEGLLKHFSKSGGSPGCLIMASTILDQAHTLFEAVAARSSYNGAITKCVTAIVVLKRKCKEYQQSGSEEQAARCPHPSLVMGPPPQVPAIAGPVTRDSSRSSSNETEQELLLQNSSGRCEEGSDLGSSVDEINTSQVGSPHALVLSAFETIWNAVCQFSAQIYYGVGFPHPVSPDLLKDLTKPTQEEAIQFLGRLSSSLELVVTAIQSVLQEPVGNETGNLQVFETLLQAIGRFFKEVLSMNTGVTVADLVRFARDPNARMGLIQGCSQLDRALATLQQCSRWIASTVVSSNVSW